MRFAIFGNTSPEKFSGKEPEIFRIAKKMGHEISTPKGYYEFLRHNSDIEIPCDYQFTGEDFQADAVISIGGDGTFLRTAARIGSKSIPIIGINQGRLGFLADITIDMTENAIQCISEGKFKIEKRNLLELRCSAIPEGHTPYALNDIAILKHDISSMISIHTSVDGEPLTTYMADGLVVATPTGSTAYSLSVGGPVIVPGTNVISLTPVAPHSLTMRPLILQGSSIVSMTVESRSHNFLISIDGLSFSCPEGVPMEIRQAPFRLSVIHPEGCSFYSTLRQKMMWGTDTRS